MFGERSQSLERSIQQPPTKMGSPFDAPAPCVPHAPELPGENFFDFFMTPFFQELELSQNPGRFNGFQLVEPAAVGQHIEQEFGIRLQVRSIGKCLARWGFTSQKPLKKAYEQRPEPVQQWLA